MMYVLIALAGMLNAVQSGSNATLNKSLHHPFVAALVSFGTGTVMLLLALGVYAAITKAPLPGSQQWAQMPWWGWIGGTLGAVYILSMVITA